MKNGTEKNLVRTKYGVLVLAKKNCCYQSHPKMCNDTRQVCLIYTKHVTKLFVLQRVLLLSLYFVIIPLHQHTWYANNTILSYPQT
jgi:hypothetical protein